MISNDKEQSYLKYSNLDRLSNKLSDLTVPTSKGVVYIAVYSIWSKTSLKF